MSGQMCYFCGNHVSREHVAADRCAACEPLPPVGGIGGAENASEELATTICSFCGVGHEAFNCCEWKERVALRTVAGIDGSVLVAPRAEVARLGKELKALKETFGRDGDYLKQEAEKEDAWKEDLPYRGKTAWAWWAKAHAYGCMVHGINPILGAGEGEQTADAARRVVAERDALKKEVEVLKGIERQRWEGVNKVFGTKYPAQMNEGESAKWTDGGRSAAQWGEVVELKKELESRRWECLEWQQKHDALLMGLHK